MITENSRYPNTNECCHNFHKRRIRCDCHENDGIRKAVLPCLEVAPVRYDGSRRVGKVAHLRYAQNDGNPT